MCFDGALLQLHRVWRNPKGDEPSVTVVCCPRPTPKNMFPRGQVCSVHLSTQWPNRHHHSRRHSVDNTAAWSDPTHEVCIASINIPNPNLNIRGSRTSYNRGTREKEGSRTNKWNRRSPAGLKCKVQSRSVKQLEPYLLLNCFF